MKDCEKKYVIEVIFLRTGVRELFSSIKAIYEWHAPSELGVGYGLLGRAGLHHGKTYQNDRIRVIRRFVFGRVKIKS